MRSLVIMAVALAPAGATADSSSPPAQAASATEMRAALATWRNRCAAQFEEGRVAMVRDDDRFASSKVVAQRGPHHHGDMGAATEVVTLEVRDAQDRLRFHAHASWWTILRTRPLADAGRWMPTSTHDLRRPQLHLAREGGAIDAEIIVDDATAERQKRFETLFRKAIDGCASLLAFLVRR
jgi:hypothetical protein